MKSQESLACINDFTFVFGCINSRTCNLTKVVFTESISSQIYLHEIMIFYSTLEFATFITYGGFVCIFHCNGAYDIISLLHNCQDLHAEARTSGQDTCW